MRYVVTFQFDDQQIDLAVRAEPESTVGDLTVVLAARHPQQALTKASDLALAVMGPAGPSELAADQLLSNSGLHSGAILNLRRRSGTIEALAAPKLRVIGGSDDGRTFTLLPGVNTLGRADRSDIRLDDELVSRAHAQIIVGADIEVCDSNSANGVSVDGAVVSRIKLAPGQRLSVGETTLCLELPAGANPETSEPRCDQFIRSPRLSPRFEEESHPAPELPKKPRKPHFPATMLMAPLLMGAMLYALTQRIASLMFVALMPMMMIGMWFENRRSTKKQTTEAWQTFHRDLQRLDEIVSARQERERLVRKEENPSVDSIIDATAKRSSLLWSRRVDRAGFGQLRLGLGPRTSRVSVSLSAAGSADPRAWNELRSHTAAWAQMSDVPVVGDLGSCGSIGVAGLAHSRRPVGYGLLLQGVGLHSPNELAVGCFLGPESTDAWDWLKWLPHTNGDFSPVAHPLLTSGLGQASKLATELEKLILDRSSDRSQDPTLPLILIVVENDCPLDRARIVAMAESGPAVGIHFLWSAADVTQLPAAARAFVVVDDAGGSRCCFVTDSEAIHPLRTEPISQSEATVTARAMAPIVDSGVKATREPDLPQTVSYLGLVGSQMADDPNSVTERWRETGSLLRFAEPSNLPTRLRALIGQTATEPYVVDLAAQGPHALVGGTTGSGKSELLQTWVLALANDYSPDRVNFLFVDYKGGSAFADCVNLPHSVGLVTDLTPRLVSRALQSLNAEVQRRERILNGAGAKDIEAMERAANPATPPRLIIVVDEFAALTQEVPEFVDGVVNIAQRGRSLGLHLILATQRPAGVIKENLRANTNLRIALRMADQTDSTDVLGVDTAAHFDPKTPGRAAARSGPARLAHFQAAYVGGHTESSLLTSAQVSISPFRLGGDQLLGPTEAVTSPSQGNPVPPSRTDLQRLVSCISRAAAEGAVADPRKPWLPELSNEMDLIDIVNSAVRDSTIPFARGDQPRQQKQLVVGFDPDRSGNMTIYGTGGSGKSSALRSLAVAGVLSDRDGPTHVYGLDYGSRGLAMLEQLPHVGAVIGADDHERTERLMLLLEETMQSRAGLFAAAGAATLSEYRELTGSPDVPRILLLLDGLAAFRKAHEATAMPNPYESLLALATDGRTVGIHVIMTADRPGTVPSALASVTPTRLVLRIASENDLALLNVPKNTFDEGTPPGRGIMNDSELQVGVVGGSTSISDQARVIAKLANEALPRWNSRPPVRIGRLPDQVDLTKLPADVAGRPVIGLEDRSLSPIGYRTGGTFLITGPPGSGRTTALHTMVRSTQRANPGVRTALLAANAGELTAQLPWDHSATGASKVAHLAEQLSTEMAGSNEGNWLIVLEDAGSFVNGPADVPLQTLIKAARSLKHTVLGEGDTQSMQGSWPLLLALRGMRRGIVMQPDRSDGDLLFRTPFPRLKRTEFPLGRGLLVCDGQTQRVQVAR